MLSAAKYSLGKISLIHIRNELLKRSCFLQSVHHSSLRNNILIILLIASGHMLDCVNVANRVNYRIK